MKVCILHDDPNWAQGRHSAGLQKYAPKGMTVDRFTLKEFRHSREHDVVYCINLASSSPMMGNRVVACVASHAWQHEERNEANQRTYGTTRNRNSALGRTLVKRLNGVVCRNRELHRWAARWGKATCIPAGVDTAIFNPGNRKPNKKLRVGWCGQINPERENHFKGFYSVYQPLVERLGHKYEFVHNPNTAKTANGIQQMAEWYRSLDVFLCTAAAEGTPNPPMEAAASGCVVVSTDVGQIADWDTLRDMGLIVPDYGTTEEALSVVDEFESVLTRLESNTLRYELTQAILASIEMEYDYRMLAPKTLEAVCGF